MSKIDRYTEIKNILATTSRVEQDTLLNLLEIQPESEHRAKAIQLIRQLIQYPNATETQVVLALKLEKEQKVNLRALYTYAKRIIFDSLLLDANIERPMAQSSAFRNRLQSAKIVLQSEILIGKGLYTEASNLIDESISKSLKYNQYGLIQQGLYLKLLANLQKFSPKTARQHFTEIDLAKKQQNAINEIQSEFLSVHMNLGTGGVEREKALSTAIQKAEAANKAYPTTQGLYFTLLLKAKWASEIFNFEKAKTHLETALKLLKKEPSINSKSREVDLAIELSLVYAKLGLIDQSKQLLITYKPGIKKNSIESYIISKRLIMIALYSNDHIGAELQITRLLHFKQTIRQPFARIQYQYLRAVQLLFKHQPKHSCLNMIELFKSDLDISNELRLGGAMMLALTSFDIAENDPKLASTARSIATKNIGYIKTSLLNRRDNIILDTVNTLLVTPKNKPALRRTLQRQLQKIKSEPQSNQWRPFGFEVFKIENWLSAKIEDSPCKYSLV